MVNIYMVANLILLSSLKTYLSFKTWRTTLQENMGYLCSSIFSFFRRASEYPLFQISWTLVHCLILSLFYLNYFCIAHASFFAIETFQERHLQELGAFILSSIFLCLFPVQEQNIFGGWKTFFVYSQCRSSTYEWSVCDLDLESMISFSTRVTRFDQTQYHGK